jgi:UDP-N-acetylglucosamine transferase subunit ALG13
MPSPKPDPRPLVFATVGTDHHPFDRLVGWVDAWLSRRSRDVRCFIQRGTSNPPGCAPSTDYLSYQALQAALGDAHAVVCHGGPATIMLSVAAARRPIVVPRRRDLGEHVDDHQVLFTRRIAGEGVIRLAETQETFEALLDRALQEPQAAGPAAVRESVGETVERFEALVDSLLAPLGAAPRRGRR